MSEQQTDRPKNRKSRPFLDNFLSIDARSLALGRVALAIVLIVDLLRRLPELELWYTNSGLLPNHTVLWRPSFAWSFSFFYMASHWYEALLGFALCLVFYTQLLVGWRTRIAQVASYLCVLSLHSRVGMLGNGGDVVLCELAFWTMFLPTGRCYSLDAAKSDACSAAVSRGERIYSLACLALLLQLFVIYLFNCIQKLAPGSWFDGSTVHYVLHQDRLVTMAGVWLRDVIPYGVQRVMTWLTLLCEGLIALFLVIPSRSTSFRTVAVVMIFGLHAGFALCLNLGIFSYVMMAFGLHFLPGEVAGRLFAICGFRAPPPPRVDVEMSTLQKPRCRRRAGAVIVGFFMLVVTTQMLVENKIFYKNFQFPQPRIFDALVTYLHLFQGWQMFAPDAPTSDMTIVVQASTADGRTVDPLNELFGRVSPKLTEVVPVRLGYSALVCEYVSRIGGHSDYFGAFREWILDYPRRTGRPDDRIVAFEVYEIADRSPSPGAREPVEPSYKPLFNWREG